MTKRFRVMLLCFTIILTLIPSAVMSQTATTSKIDVVFVLDASSSMAKSDPGNIRLDALKMFVDMAELNRTQIGIVTFSDRIVDKKEMVDLKAASDKINLKSYISTIPLNQGGTDIGLALKAASELLQSKHDPSHSQFIVLLSDGRTDLSDLNGQRTMQNTNDDEQYAITKAKENGYPIYTIGLNYDGTVDQEELKRISSGTGTNGTYITQSASDLPDILNNIFARHIGTKINKVADLTTDGKLQSVEFDITDSTVLAANVILISTKGVSEVHVYNPGGSEIPVPSQSVVYSSGSLYSMYKILTPDKGKWKVEIRGVPEDRIKVDLVLSRDFVLKFEAKQDGDIRKGAKIEARTYLSNDAGQNINDAEIYKASSATMEVTDLDNGSVTGFPLVLNNNSYVGTYELPENHSYQTRAVLLSGNLNFKSELVSFKYGQSISPSPSGKGTTPKSKPIMQIVAIVIGILLLIIIAIFVFKKFRPLRFKYGSISVDVRGRDITISPITWDLGGRSHNRTKQRLDEILDYMCGRNGSTCESILPRSAVEKVVFMPEKSGNLLFSVGAGTDVLHAEPISGRQYMLTNRNEAVLHFDETETKVTISYSEV